jgi:hypothetical protein
MSEQDFPLPPPTFEFLVFSLKTQAELRLGILSYAEKPEQPDLRASRHAIDLLGMIAEKTRGNLSLDEQRLIENALTELRFRYVQVSEDVAKSAAAASATAASSSESGASKEATGEAAPATETAAATEATTPGEEPSQT